MIKIFDCNDTDFSSNGNIAIEPLKCIETKKKSLNGWFIDVEISIEYKDYIFQDQLCVIKSKSKINPQAFSICDVSYTTNTILFEAEHVAFRSRDYFLLDCRPTNLNGSGALNYVNQHTETSSPFSIVSDVETISTAYFIRKSLLESWEIIEERWGGTFDFDNYTVYFKHQIGNDNGEIVSYRKNLQDFRIYEDWSDVVTRLYPIGPNELMLPEKFLESDVQYLKPYTKSIVFDIELEQEEQSDENLLSELRRRAQNYIESNKYPRVCYEVVSNIVQNVNIGDIIHVKHPLVELSTEVQEYEFNHLTKRITKLIFGNYDRNVKTKVSTIKNDISSANSKISQQQKVINDQTNRINNLNKRGLLYIDDNELLAVDTIPKENATDVLKLGLGGLGISESGIDGPFVSAVTGKGINADCITTGTVKTNRIEGYSELITTVSDQDKKIAETIVNVNEMRNVFQITGGSNLIKDSQWLLDDDVWVKSETGEFSGGYDGTLAGKTIAVSKIGLRNGIVKSKEGNINELVIGQRYNFSFLVTNEANTETTIRLKGNNVVYEETFAEAISFEEISISFIAETSSYTFEFISETTMNGWSYIYDLMLNAGDKKPWEPARSEIKSTVLQMSQLGLRIFCTGSSTATLMTSAGFQVWSYRNGELYEVITEFTDKGIVTKLLYCTELHMQQKVETMIKIDGIDHYSTYIEE